MRPRLIEYLNEFTGIPVFNYVIPSPSLVYPIAFFAAAYIFFRRATASSLDRKHIWICIFAGGVGAILGAKLFYVFLHFDAYVRQPSHLFAPGGTVSWGAYSGLLIVMVLYLRLVHQPVLRYLDAAGSAVMIGPFIGRWSCFLNGDDYGTVTDAAWAVQYPYGSIPHSQHFHDGLIDMTAALSAPVHPNQLYLSLNALILFFILTSVWRSYRSFEGFTIGSAGFLYGLTRFFLEFFRDEIPLQITPYLNFPHVMSLTVSLSGILLIGYAYRRRSKIHMVEYRRIS
jgi:phosphatidylglycerol---prolipoprotein diacylglyceryl transferase